MNKRYIKLSAIAFAISALTVSCDQNTLLDSTDQQPSHVIFRAVAPDTRTTFGEKAGDSYPTFWTPGDKIAIWGIQSGGAEVGTAIVSEDGRAATFSDVYNLTSSRYFAVSPYISGDILYNGGNYTEYDFNNFPTTQTPTELSCDPKAQLLFADSGVVGERADEVDFRFRHLSAYGRFELTNLPDDAGKVTAIKLYSGKPWVGEGEIHFLEDFEDMLVVASNKHEITINTALLPEGSPYWFGCYPVDLSDSYLNVTVLTENGEKYEKYIDMTQAEQPLNLQSGIVAEFTVDMTGTGGGDSEDEEGTYFIADGDKVDCTVAIVKETSYNNMLTVAIGNDASARKVYDIDNGSCLYIEIDRSKVTDLDNFSLEGCEVYVKTDKLFYSSGWDYPSSDACTGTASVTMNAGTLTFTVKDGHMPAYSNWGAEFPAFDFSVSYKGPYIIEE